MSVISPEIEMKMFLDALLHGSDYNFHNYAKSHLSRRINHRLECEGLSYISEMIPLVLHDADFRKKILNDLSINVTEMFRDPDFYKNFRDQILPLLLHKKKLRIWHAGCSTGQEPYSMAIMLHESNLPGDYSIFASDFNEGKLQEARNAIYSFDNIKKYTSNYNEFEGKDSFSNYYSAQYKTAKLNKEITSKVSFFHQNLVHDNYIEDLDIIFCRNVLIYFNKDLQNHVLHGFYKSLKSGGILCLGTKETIQFSVVEELFETLDSENKIYRKLSNG